MFIIDVSGEIITFQNFGLLFQTGIITLMKMQLIQLDKFDDVHSVIDKIKWSKSSRLLLVFPRRGKLLRQALDIRRVNRAVHDLGSQVGFVTLDESLTSLAIEEGVPVFRSIAEARKSPWRGAGSLRPRLDEPRPKSQILAEREVVHRQPAQGLWHQIIRILSFIVGVAAVFALVFTFLPSATIIVTPTTHEQKMDLTLYTDRGVLEGSLGGAVPATEVSTTLELSGTAVSTGLVVLGTGTAQVEVLFTNLTADVVTIPAGTVVTTTSEPTVRFQVNQAVEIPGEVGDTVTANATAMQQGSAGNIVAGSITAIEGGLGTRVTVINPVDASGGTDQNSPAPSQADVESLKTQLLATVPQRGLEEITRLVPSDAVIISNSIEVVEVLGIQTSPAVGVPADQFTLVLQLRVSALTYQKAEVDGIAQKVLDATLPMSFTPAEEPILVTQLTEPEPQSEGYTWKVSVSRTVRSVESLTEEINNITGKRIEDAEKVIENSGDWVTPPVITVFPKGWPRMPFLPFQIRVEDNL